MLFLLVAMVLPAWSIVATVRRVMRDGRRRVPTAAVARQAVVS